MGEVALDPRKWLWRRCLVYLTNAASFGLFWRVVETDASGAGVIAIVSGLILLLTVMNLSYVFAPSMERAWDMAVQFFPFKNRSSE